MAKRVFYIHPLMDVTMEITGEWHLYEPEDWLRERQEVSYVVVEDRYPTDAAVRRFRDEGLAAVFGS